MSGIVGIWNRDGRAADSALLGAMADRIAYRGPDGRSVEVEGPLGLGALHSKVTPESANERLPLRGH